MEKRKEKWKEKGKRKDITLRNGEIKRKFKRGFCKASYAKRPRQC